MKTELLLATERLVSASLNGLYQGIIVAALVALGLRLLPRTNAATRHAVWFCTLLLVVSLMGTHCLREFLPGPAVPLALGGGAIPDAAPEVVQPYQLTTAFPEKVEVSDDGIAAQTTASIEEGLPGEQIEQTVDSLASPSAANVDASAVNGGSSLQEPANNSQIAGPDSKLRRILRQVINPSGASPAAWKLTFGAKAVEISSVLLLASWLMIAAVKIVVLLVRVQGIRKLKQNAFSPTRELNEFFYDLRGRLGVRRKVKLSLSSEHRSPVLLGFLHPVILLPAEGTPEGTDHVLRHELAHVTRWDDWANLAQHFIQAILFFHPAVWWISKQLSLEREIACDDAVLQQSGRPRAYALLLANLAGRLQGCPPLLAPGVSNYKTQLQKRIEMILDTNRNTSPYLAKTRLGVIASAAALIAVVAIYAAPRVVFAQSETTPPPAVPPVPAVPVAGFAAVNIAPAAPDGIPAETDLAAPSPAPDAVGAGPKAKPGTSFSVNLRPLSTTVAPSVVLAAPVAPCAPVAATPAVPAMAGPETPRPPRLARTPRAKGGEESLQERLDRLERMVESLMAQQNMKLRQDPFQFQGSTQKDFEKNVAEFAKKQAEYAKQWSYNTKDMDQIKQQAEREAARATEEAKRATKDAMRAMQDAQKNEGSRKVRKGSQIQLQTLHKQLEVLERERSRLDRQIEQLERDQERLDEQQEQSSDDVKAEQSERESGAKAGERK